MPEEKIIYDFALHSCSHVSIEASAGTGKTFTITRIVRDMVKNGISLNDLAVVTFTEKAAGELTERIRNDLEKNSADDSLKRALTDLPHAVIGTIHNFCRVILRQHAEAAGRSPDFEETDADEDLLEKVFGMFYRRLEKREPDRFLALLQESSFDQFKNFIFQSARVLKGKKPLLPPNAGSSFADCILKLQAIIPEAGKGKLADYQKNLAEFKDYTGEDHKVYQKFRQIFFTGTGTFRVNVVKHLLKVQEVTESQLADMINSADEAYKLPFLEFLLSALGDFMTEYNSLLAENDLVTRDDLIVKTRDLVKNNPEVRKQIRGKYKYIIIDECQDTSPVQIDLFMALAGSDRSGLVLVGDPKQSIYRFQNADVRSYEEAKTALNGFVLPLDKTWRTSPELMAPLNLIFGNMNRLAYSPVVSARNDVKGKPALLLLTQKDGDDEKDPDRLAEIESARIADIILRITDPANGYTWYDKETGTQQPVTFADIAVIFPKKTRRHLLVRALAGRGIPVSVYKERDFYRNRIIMAASDLLKAIADPDDTVSLYRALVSDLFLVRREDLAFKSGVELDYEGGSDDPALDRIFTSLHEARSSRYTKDISSILVSVLEYNHIFLKLSCGFEGRRNIANLYHLVEILAVLQVTEGLSFDEVVYRLAENVSESKDQEIRLDTDPDDKQRKVVRLMTIHAAKGLEFPVVILSGLNSGDKKRNEIYPVSRKLEGETVGLEFSYAGFIKTSGYDGIVDQEKEEAVAEKNRLLYVAMTRAMDWLVIPWTATGGSDSLQQILFHALDERRATMAADGLVLEIDAPLPQDYKGNTAKPSGYAFYEKWEQLLDAAPDTELLNAMAGYHFNSYTSLARKEENEKGAFRPAAPVPDTDLSYNEEEDPVTAEEQFVRGLFWRRKKDAGRVFGDVCHKVLEEAGRFDSSSDLVEKLGGLVDSYYANSGLLEDEGYTSDDMVGMCHSALTCSYELGNIPTTFFQWENRRTEKSFYFVDAGKRYFGIGDLMFSSGGKYYILDWKTTNLADYSLPGMRQFTEEHYSHQVNLYCYNFFCNMVYQSEDEKERRTLWKEKFGGMIYVYLRGFSENKGYVVMKPSYDEMNRFRDMYNHA